tara:strand:+ start:97 stop:339 length:243 start_codon:yes stop_codon:yes gene_type:complete
MKSIQAKRAVSAIKKGDVPKTLENIISALIERFDEDDWKGAKVADLISLLVLYRGTQIEDVNGDSPIDNWLVSVSRKTGK